MYHPKSSLGLAIAALSRWRHELESCKLIWKPSRTAAVQLVFSFFNICQI